MRTGGVAFEAERIKYATEPRAIVALRFARTRDAATTYAFSRALVSHAGVISAAEGLVCVQRISGNSQTVDPIAGRSTMGAVTLELTDRGAGELRRQLADPALPLRTAIASSGAIQAVDVAGDVSVYPARGTVTIDGEDCAYLAVDVANNRLTGIMRITAPFGMRQHGRLDDEVILLGE